MVAVTADLAKSNDELTQQTILLAARVALRIYSMDSRELAIDLRGIVADEAVSNPRTGYRLAQCLAMTTWETMFNGEPGPQWRREFAYGAVMSVLHTLVNYRLACRTKFHL